MPRVVWALHSDRPHIEIELFSLAKKMKVRRLIADTGAGNAQSAFELVLPLADCQAARGHLMGQVQLRGAYAGMFPVYSVKVHLPQLGFKKSVTAVGATNIPNGFDGIAGFKFLDRFHYGNFGTPNQFGLE